jgi:hypothetical protein
VSAAYYTRLEQGNAQNVSASVLDAIADALRLNSAERAHLTDLVRPVHRRRPAARAQRVRPALQQLLDAMEAVPAYILGRRMEVLAWNRMGAALIGDFAAMPPEHRNFAWLVFLDPAAREFYDDWEGKASDVVAQLRLSAGRHPDDPKLASLIGELSMKCPDFRRLWAAHDVRDKGPCTKDLHHPVVGPLTLSFESMLLPADADLILATYHAEPGSPSAEALRLLASWSTAAGAGTDGAAADRAASAAG